MSRIGLPAVERVPVRVERGGRLLVAYTASPPDAKLIADAEALEKAAREDATEKHVVTPGPILPARELQADKLLEFNQPGHHLGRLNIARISPRYWWQTGTVRC